MSGRLRSTQHCSFAGNDLPALAEPGIRPEPLLNKASSTLEAYPTTRTILAFWNFSGGTTGKPKGVPHSHDSLVYGFVGATHHAVHA